MYELEPDLIAACIEGVPDAWAAFRTRYRTLVRAVVVRTSAVDEATVDDLEALVYQKLLEDRCRRLRNWQGRARFSTYLVQVTRNQVLDWVDARQRTLSTTPMDERADAPMEGVDLAEAEETAAQHAALRTAIAALPEKQALILKLRIEGKSLRDIAELLNRPVGTISVENSRAMARVRTHLEQTGLFAKGARA